MLIVGIEPKSPGLHIFSKAWIPRLGLPQILTIAENMGHSCFIYCEDFTSIDWEIVRKADLILISTITSTAPRAYSLIKKIKDHVNKNAPILMGGPHVTFITEEALNEGADYVFRNEADDSFPKFINWFEDTKSLNDLFKIKGISFKYGSEIHHTPDPDFVDLNKLPTPNLDTVVGFDNPETIPIISSRGCPWACDFCSEVSMFGRKYRFRSEEKVIDDIKYYNNRYGRKTIFMADDNFGANLSRLEKLCHAIIKNKLVHCIEGQIRLDLAKHPDALRLMNRAGFQRAYIGYESVNPDTLREVGKGISDDSILEFTKQIHKSGIAIHAMWVLGFDSDSIETIKQTVKFSIKSRIETTQFLILVPLPGSSLFDRFKKEKRIFNWDWSKFDGHHVNYYPKKISARQLQTLVTLDSMIKFYAIGRTARIFIINNIRNLKRSINFNRFRPVKDFRNNLTTLFARIWGNFATRRMKKPIKRYIDDMPAFCDFDDNSINNE
jgi:radical SAM superfamily enzyme YgiQ (UPF0313 family)